MAEEDKAWLHLNLRYNPQSSAHPQPWCGGRSFPPLSLCPWPTPSRALLPAHTLAQMLREARTLGRSLALSHSSSDGSLILAGMQGSPSVVGSGFGSAQRDDGGLGSGSGVVLDQG